MSLLSAARCTSKGSRISSRSFTTSSSLLAHKEVKFSNDGRAAMLAGVNLLANAVSVTLGPKGKSTETSHSRERDDWKSAELKRSRGSGTEGVRALRSGLDY